MSSMIAFLYVIASVLTNLHTASSQLLSKATDDYTPTHLWQLDSAHHGLSSNLHRLHAVLHQVHLQPGPFSNTRNASLAFQGTPASYVRVPNPGVLNATSAFSWILLIKPSKVSEHSVILEYWDGTGGIRLKQAKKNLVVEAHDTQNDLKTLTKTNILRANVWTFLTVTFMGFDKKKFKLIVSDHDETSAPSDKEEMGVDDGTVLRGTGDIRLGASADPNLLAFSGNIGCLRFYNSYIGKFQTGYALTCDPLSTIFSGNLDSLSENTIDYVESTTAVLMTPAQETTEDSTTSEPLTSTDALTPLLTTAPYTGVPTTLDSMPSSPGNLIGGIEMHFTEETCVRLLQETGTFTFSTNSLILSDIQTRSLNTCAGACASTSGCKAIAIEKKVKDQNIAGRCILGGSGYSTAANTEFYFYHLSG